MRNLGLGIGAHGFAPLSFDRLYLGASLGLSHGFGWGASFFDYGIRYSPLIEASASSSQTMTGYHGVLANVGYHWPIRTGTYTMIGLQFGVYQPFTTGSQAIWVLQPLTGLNLSF